MLTFPHYFLEQLLLLIIYSDELTVDGSTRTVKKLMLVS